MTSNEPNKTPSRQGIYAKVSKYAPEAIETIYEMMRTAKNESVRIAAANKILDKCIPDLKAIEGAPSDGVQFIVKVINESKDGNTSN